MNYSIIRKISKKRYFKIKKVLVFGGGGYIGCVLVDMLIKLNFNVTVYDKFIYTSKKSFIKNFENPNLKVIQGDFKTYQRFLKLFVKMILLFILQKW